MPDASLTDRAADRCRAIVAEHLARVCAEGGGEDEMAVGIVAHLAAARVLLDGTGEDTVALFEALARIVAGDVGGPARETGT